MILISDGLAYTSEQQFAPFLRHRKQLRRELGLHVDFASPNQSFDVPRYCIVGLKLSFKADPEHAASLIRDVRKGGKAKIVYFDGDDDLNVQWKEVLECCDLYTKKHAYVDRAEYTRERIGKSNLTDWVARHYNYSFDSDPIPRTPPIENPEKIWVGWDISLDDKIARVAKAIPQIQLDGRPFDVCSRIAVNREQWIFPLRHPVVDRLRDMNCKAIVPSGRVSQREYYDEMLRSKLCVSPFGYGEICWRDFEAMLCGCLVIKPDMSHVETAANLFQPGVTYAPVNWDFSNLAEVCDYYLRNPIERVRIADRARFLVRSLQSSDWFVTRVREMLARLNLLESTDSLPLRIP